MEEKTGDWGEDGEMREGVEVADATEEGESGLRSEMCSVVDTDWAAAAVGGV